MACPKGIAVEMERSGWIWNVLCNRENCSVVLESCVRKLTHTHIHAFSFHEHSLKSICQIMGLLAISEKTTVFEVWRVLGKGGGPCVSLRVVHGYGSAGPGIFDSWIQGETATHTVYVWNQSIMKIKSENSALALEGNRILKRLSQNQFMR